MMTFDILRELSVVGLSAEVSRILANAGMRIHFIGLFLGQFADRRRGYRNGVEDARTVCG